MEVEVKYNQSLIDVAIEHLGSAEMALDIALLNGISLTDVLVPGTSLLLPEVRKTINTEALPVTAAVTEASLLQLLTAHTAIMGGAVAGHVRNGGNVRVDPEGRMWVTFPDYVTNWDDIEGKPTEFPPSAHNHDWSAIDNKPIAYPPSAHTHTDLGSKFSIVGYISPLSTFNTNSIACSNTLDFSIAQSKTTNGIRITSQNNNGSYSHTDIVTISACIVIYIPVSDEYWAIETPASATKIYRISRSSKTLLETITVDVSSSTRQFFEYANGYVYYCTGSQIVQMNIISRTKKYYSVASCNTCFPFTHNSVNYLYVAGNIVGIALNENMEFVQNINTASSSWKQAVTYYKNKLYVGIDGGWFNLIADLTSFPNNVSTSVGFSGISSLWMITVGEYIIARSPDYSQYLLYKDDILIGFINNGNCWYTAAIGYNHCYNAARKELYMNLLDVHKNVVITKVNI